MKIYESHNGRLRSLSDTLRRKYEVLEGYLSELRRELDLKLVILFGSLARGDWKESSDTDFMKLVESEFKEVRKKSGLKWVDGTWTWKV